MVENFINQFSNYNSSIEMFTCGLCYWFAFILQEQFNGEIYYHPIHGHFVTKITNNLYDITGNVTNKYLDNNLILWYDLCITDSTWAKRIKRDCIDKENINE